MHRSSRVTSDEITASRASLLLIDEGYMYEGTT